MPTFDQLTQYVVQVPTDTGDVIAVSYSIETATADTSQTDTQPTQADYTSLKEEQVALIAQGYQQAMLAGFASSADGTARTYAADPEALQELGWVRDLPQTSYPAAGIDARLNDGTHIALNYTQMQVLIGDVQAFFLSFRQQNVNLAKQAQSATTPADIRAVVWTNPVGY